MSFSTMPGVAIATPQLRSKPWSLNNIETGK